MALPKKKQPDPDNPLADGPNWEALMADPWVVIRHRPPGTELPPFESNIRVLPGTDVLELLGRGPYEDDDTDE